jgi:hypothetical protein
MFDTLSHLLLLLLLLLLLPLPQRVLPFLGGYNLLVPVIHAIGFLLRGLRWVLLLLLLQVQVLHQLFELYLLNVVLLLKMPIRCPPPPPSPPRQEVIFITRVLLRKT